MSTRDEDLTDFGIVVYFKDEQGKDRFYYLLKEDWEKKELAEANSGLAHALVERGAIIAHMKDETAPAGSWSTLLNLPAAIAAAKATAAPAKPSSKNS